jgi:hypothetical protein
VKQVSAWLGHADAGFTLRTNVHLMGERVGDAAFMDEAGTQVLTDKGRALSVSFPALAIADPVALSEAT